MMRATATHLHLGRIAGPASVLDVDALHRHLRTSGLLEDHLRHVVQVIAAALGALRARVAFPRDLAVVARESDLPVVERLPGERVI